MVLCNAFVVDFQVLKDRMASHFGNYEYALWNSYIFSSDWESDYFCISKSGYMTEVEIKMSKSDFKADFKKTRKHEIMGSERKIYTKPGSAYMHGYNNDTKKWDVPLANSIEVVQVSKCAPNKFYYCCPDGLIESHEVPVYAGLLWVNEGRLLVVKNAPYIHKEKRNPDFLFNKFYYLSLEQKREILELEHQIKRAKDTIHKLVVNPSSIDTQFTLQSLGMYDTAKLLQNKVA